MFSLPYAMAGLSADAGVESLPSFIGDVVN
jgi:hypothetical protein